MTFLFLFLCFLMMLRCFFRGTAYAYLRFSLLSNIEISIGPYLVIEYTSVTMIAEWCQRFDAGHV